MKGALLNGESFLHAFLAFSLVSNNSDYGQDFKKVQKLLKKMKLALVAIGYNHFVSVIYVK